MSVGHFLQPCNSGGEAIAGLSAQRTAGYTAHAMNPATAILEAFHQCSGQYVSADDLHRKLKLNTRDISREILELEALGYHIESHPHLGYRLLASPDRLTADDIKARLNTQTIGSEILVFEETASTSDVIEQMAATFSGEGLVVFAETQSRGRGRHGRAWASPRGKGLWFSVLLRPKLSAMTAARLTVAASVAVTRTVRQFCRVDARIKWPNDVIVNGRKLAGILTETQANRGALKYATLGIGLNINCAREDFPGDLSEVATSLQIETGQPQDRVVLAAQLLASLEEYYRVAQSDFLAVTNEWAQFCTTLGKQVVVGVGARRIEGQAHALQGDGALLIRKDNGQTESILGGDLIREL